LMGQLNAASDKSGALERLMELLLLEICIML